MILFSFIQMYRRISKPIDVPTMMLYVLLALAPLALAQLVFFGWGVLINLVCIGLAALATEAACLALRRRPALYGLRDLSALVSAVLLALCLPPQLPPLEAILGAIFMMVLGKHIFGGLGNNPFNPAMLAYAMLLLSFPISMTTWLEPQFFVHLQDMELLRLKFSAAPAEVDAYSGATALDSYRAQRQENLDLAFTSWWVAWQANQGPTSIRPFILMNILCAGGGLWLWWARVITWHIPFSMLAGLLFPAFVLDLLGFKAAPPVWFHCVFGATVYGAFFIATDPVSAATGARARLIYGFGIGLMTFIIRTWGGYADAIAFAVLFFNFAAPFIDKYTRPLPYGHKN